MAAKRQRHEHALHPAGDFPETRFFLDGGLGPGRGKRDYGRLVQGIGGLGIPGVVHG